MEKILEINGLHKYFGKIKAVDGLSLNIIPGAVFGLLGPNGSGKTTTLGVVLDVVAKTKGDYKWYGQPPSKEIRKKIGAILEAPSFYPYLSGEDNLKIVARIKEVPFSKIKEVLEKVGLYERRSDKFQTYSLGMKQRLAIGSALLSDPQVLVLDEPTNGLDPTGIADVREIILKVSAEGKTIILASHLLDEVQKVCSHFAVLNKGKLVYSGSVKDSMGDTEKVEVASPDMEQLKETLKSCQFVLETEIVPTGLLVTLAENKNSFDLNKFLIQQGIVVSQLSTVKKNLEKQFLEILSQQQ
ncbi:MAG: ATP-binding cassette domain-containing protein [Bacteroidales bacterium]|nr:ATP-binding cassette domain-containing protein [Bacteroidales bacterium]